MPTPRPIITPSVVVKSGIGQDVAEQRDDDATPVPMPASATPIGRPMASTEPKARIRMTMAKAEAEQLGGRRLELGEH